MVSKVFPATDEALNDALSFTEEQLDIFECPMKIVMQITVCVEEMFVNVAHYAYGKDTGNVEMVLDSDGSSISITLIDEGMPFDPLAKADPDVTLSAEERNIGGLGIYMVKKSMSEVRYERVDGKNVFTMKKNFF